jgi:hypothetical protein
MQGCIVPADPSLQFCNMPLPAMRDSAIASLVYPHVIARLTESQRVGWAVRHGLCVNSPYWA